MHLLPIYHPQRLEQRFPIIEDLLGLEWDEKTAAIEMIDDLNRHGTQSRYCKKMHGPIWELKTRARGGSKGGVRVYWLYVDEVGYLVHVEAKAGDEPNRQMLADCIEIYRYLKGQ